MVLRVAGKFSTWVLGGHADPVQEQVDGIRQELQDTPPANPVYDKLHNLREKIARDPDFYKPLNSSESEASAGKWFERGKTTFGASPGDPYPLSKKQFGFLVGLHKKLKLEYDKGELNALTSRQASARIDELQAQLGETGNGNGKETMNNLTGQIRERGIR